MNFDVISSVSNTKAIKEIYINLSKKKFTSIINMKPLFISSPKLIIFVASKQFINTITPRTIDNVFTKCSSSNTHGLMRLYGLVLYK